MLEVRGPKIRVPPAFFVGGYLIALLLESLWRIELAHGRAEQRLVPLGWWIAIVGFVISISGILTFQLAGTTMFPFASASRLVQHGPYRFTRNPMYTGGVITYIGVALAMNTAWALILLPAVVFAIDRWVIRAEEQYLTSIFGDEYVAYTKRVRRWI